MVAGNAIEIITNTIVFSSGNAFGKNTPEKKTKAVMQGNNRSMKKKWNE